MSSAASGRRPVEAVVAEDLDFPPPEAPRGPMDLSAMDLTMLGHAHIDLGYRWDLEETIHRIAPDTFRGVLELMERTPGFTFCQSQMFLYDAMERHYPQLFRRIREHIQNGTWEVIGGAWCEYDAVLPSGESVIRQHLQGLGYAQDRLGVTDNEIGFVPDSFIAHAATLPQILSGCGIRYYLFGRGLPAGFPRAFRWQGRDGSSLVAYLPFGPYSNPPMTPEYLATLRPYAQSAAGTRELALYGIGDHGGGPRGADIAALEALRSIPTAPRWSYGRGERFFRDAFPADGAATLRVHTGSLRAFATGALASQAPAKRQNRASEHLLLRTEATASIATMLQRKPAYPRVDFSRLWRELLTLQAHDILPGTSAASVYRQAMSTYADIRGRAALLERDALERIRSRLDTTGEGYPLLVVNSGPRPAAGVLCAPYPPWLPRGDGYELRDHDGKPVEAVWEADAVSLVASLGPLSYRLYRAIPASKAPTPRGGTPPPGPVAAVTRGTTTVRFDPLSGDICTIESMGRLVTSRAFALELWEEEEKSTSWVQAPTGTLEPLALVEAPHIVRQDPFRTVVRTVSRSAWSLFTREITVNEHTPLVEAELRLDWRESDALLKLRTAPEPAVPARAVRASLAHGFEVVEDPRRELCMHDWVDLNAGGHGLCLFTDGAYGADLTERGLGISVIRSARDMDPTMAHGEHTLRLALLPYEGSFRQSRPATALGSFLAPLHALWDTRHRGALMRWGALDTGFSLPTASSFLSVDRENVELCAVKLPEEHYTPDGLVVRLRELDGESCRCVLRLPIPATSVWVVDHLERPVRELPGERGQAIAISLGPYEIRTVAASL